MQEDKKPLLSVNDSPATSPTYLERFLNTFKQNKSIIVWCTGNVISSVMQGVTIKQAANAMPSFPYFLFWFTAIPFTIIFGAYLLGVKFFTKQLTPEMSNVKHYKYFIVGFLTTINGVFILFANPYVPGLMQALLGPSIVTIPLSMIFSVCLVRSRYNFAQIFAVIIIVGGLVIAIYPSIAHPQPGSTGTIFWNMMFVISSIPIAFATVYEERAFAQQSIHIALMLFWSTFYQTLVIFALFWVDAIPHFGTSSSVKDIFENQYQALLCFGGVQIEAKYCADCVCHNAWLYVMLFTLSYVLSSFFAIGVVKYGNAAFSFIVSTLSTPLTEFAFACPFFMGKANVEALSPFNYGSLAVLLLGVIIYRVFDKSVHQAQTPADATLPKHDVLAPSETLHITTIPGYQTYNSRLFARKAEATPENNDYYYTYP